MMVDCLIFTSCLGFFNLFLFDIKVSFFTFFFLLLYTDASSDFIQTFLFRSCHLKNFSMITAHQPNFEFLHNSHFIEMLIIAFGTLGIMDFKPPCLLFCY